MYNLTTTKNKVLIIFGFIIYNGGKVLSMFELLSSRRELWEHLKMLMEDHDLNTFVVALNKVSYKNKNVILHQPGCLLLIRVLLKKGSQFFVNVIFFS